MSVHETAELQEYLDGADRLCFEDKEIRRTLKMAETPEMIQNVLEDNAIWAKHRTNFCARLVGSPLTDEEKAAVLRRLEEKPNVSQM